MEKGYVQIYTGHGKGKTTAALGLGLRAVGEGLSVVMVQFLKGTHTSELNSIATFGEAFQVKRIGEHKKFFWTLSAEEKQVYKEQVQREFDTIKTMTLGGKYDVVILDEVLGALSNEMVSVEQLLELIELKPLHIELVLTGRDAPQAIIERGDVVTEMKMIKHYYQQGVQSRRGIEF
jgi:cob(I)alamin adenosyltransferase